MQYVVHRTGWVLAGVVSLSVLAAIASIVRAGPLDPPAAPGPTLPQVEPRMPIPPVGWDGTFPIAIKESGSYFLTENLTDSTSISNGIEISASHVQLDLDGFTLAATSSDGYTGIAATSAYTDITVRNGVITGWAGNAGIDLEGAAITVEGLTVNSNIAGIVVGSGSTVRRVTAEENTTAGILIGDPTGFLGGSLIEDSVVSRNQQYGINVSADNVTVRNCTVEQNASSGVVAGNAADVVEDNSLIGNGGYGVDLGGPGVNHDSVVRNIFHGDTLGGVYDGGTADIIGPMDTTGASSEPWSNLSY